MCTAGSVCTVSYTHLDVYKRQVVRTSNVARHKIRVVTTDEMDLAKPGPM